MATTREPMAPPGDGGRPPSTRQVALGVFVVGQLLFLAATNAIEVVRETRTGMPAEVARVVDRLAPGWPEGKGHLWDLSDRAYKDLTAWVQLTGQDQNWSLFAPGVSKHSWFPAVLLSWEDDPWSAAGLARPVGLLGAGGGLQAAALANLVQLRPDDLWPPEARRASPALLRLAADNPLSAAALALAGPPDTPALPPSEVLLSDNEPADPQHYFRAGRFRLRRYECGILPGLAPRPDEAPRARDERWADVLRGHTREYGPMMLAYLRWRHAEYARRHPEKGPARQVILLERRYGIHAPAVGPPGWDGPFTVPLARWRPAVRWQADRLAIEAYNPAAGRFEGVRK